MTPSIRILAAAATVALAAGLATVAGSQPKAPALAYTADGKMLYPKDYRTWVYLSTGVDMSYADVGAAAAGDNHIFDSVFVNREAYDVFQKTGKWPDKTVMVL